MKPVVIVSRALLGVLGATLIVLGVVFWSGHALSLVPLHMALGFLFVAVLWVLAALAARSRAPIRLVIAGFLWGALIPAVGYAQLSLMPGPNHWIIRVVHLVVGIIGMALGGALSARVAWGRGGPGGRVPARLRPSERSATT